jgi:hypothetical protein
MTSTIKPILADVANDYYELRKVIESFYNLGFDVCEPYYYGENLNPEYKLPYNGVFVLNVLSHLDPNDSHYREILSLLRDMSSKVCPFNMFLHAFDFIISANLHVKVSPRVFSDFIELPNPPTWFMLELTSKFVDEVSFRKGFFWLNSMYDHLEAMHHTIINGERLFTLFEKFFDDCKHPTIYYRYCSVVVSHKYHEKYESADPIVPIVRPDFTHDKLE